MLTWDQTGTAGFAVGGRAGTWSSPPPGRPEIIPASDTPGMLSPSGSMPSTLLSATSLTSRTTTAPTSGATTAPPRQRHGPAWPGSINDGHHRLPRPGILADHVPHEKEQTLKLPHMVLFELLFPGQHPGHELLRKRPDSLRLPSPPGSGTARRIVQPVLPGPTPNNVPYTQGLVQPPAAAHRRTRSIHGTLP